MGRRLRIIVADDEEGLRQIFTYWLEQLGHHVEAVAGGIPLVELCRATGADLVISDVRMPDLDGLSAAEAIRRTSSIPIILISGSWDNDQMARARELGIPFFSKPIAPLTLVQAIALVQAGADSVEHRALPTAPSSIEALILRQVDTTEEVAILTLDPEGRVLNWNRGAELVFGYGRAEMLGRPWMSLFTPTDSEAGIPKAQIASASDRREVRSEGWLLRSDGSEFWAHWILNAIRSSDGGISGFGIMARDRTDLKRHELQCDLEMARLRDADENRLAFLAILAHELRNPLAPLQNFAQLLGIKFHDPEVVSIAEKMQRQIRQLDGLVEDLVDASRIGRGKMRLDRRIIDLREVVKRSVEMAAPRSDEAGHRLQLSLPDAPVWLDGDPDRLCQVLVNLFNNAVKFTPAPGSIAIAVEPQPNAVVLKVRDSGIGIPPERLDEIFGLFAQIARGPAQAKAGLGIGLALVKELIGLHGGTVYARSEGENRGSEFVVRLPAFAR